MTDFTDDDALAAEYVLGTLTSDERAAAETRRARDPGFEALVAQWEARFAPLAQAVPSVEPPPGLYARVLSRLPTGDTVQSSDTVIVLRRNIRVWRGVAAVASALAAILAIWIVERQTQSPAAPAQTYVAVLQHGADQPAFVVSLDLANRKMLVMPLATSAPPGKSYELWMIGADHGTPRSMGVLDPQAALRPRLPDVDSRELSNATYAVTLEPQGGSPTGQPTSAPVFIGKLMNTSL